MDDMLHQDTPGAPDPVAPSGIERRMVLRLLTYWRKIAAEQPFAALEMVVADDIPDTWPHCFLLDLGGDEADPVITSIGSELSKYWSDDLTGRAVSEIPKSTLLSQAVSYVPEFLRKRVPISRGGGFIQYDGAQILYRSILLPMTRDSESMDTILGAANCRIVVEA